LSEKQQHLVPPSRPLGHDVSVSTMRSATVERLKRSVRQSALYRFNGKEYALQSGTNPVPGIQRPVGGSAPAR
jgi:hypothetical protein